MKLVSWNVNGIRATVNKGFFDVLDQFDADVFCIQETKAQDDQVTEALAGKHKYHLNINSAEKKGYSGTCIFSREEPIAFTRDIGLEKHDQEGRVTHAEYAKFHFVNVYVPNSGSGLKRLDYRADWDKAFAKYLKVLTDKKPLIVTGDFNVAHTEIDLARPKPNYNKTAGYTQKEIDGLDNILESCNLIDSFRALHPDVTDKYTFWNQRFRARDRNVGWRIDYFLVSESLMPKVTAAEIHDEVMGSDHCPVSLEIDI